MNAKIGYFLYLCTRFLKILFDQLNMNNKKVLLLKNKITHSGFFLQYHPTISLKHTTSTQ